MHFRSIKDAVAWPLHRLGFRIAGTHKGFGRVLFASFGALARTAYFVPGSYLRRTVENFSQAAGRSDPWLIYSRMVKNLEEVALHYATLYRYGRSELLAQTVLDTTFETEHERLNRKGQGVIIVVPHCAAAVLSSARLSTFCQTVLLVREPKDIRRCELMLAYLRKLGPELILTRTTAPTTVMRNLARALRENKVVVGTTDLLNSGRDTIQAQAFGQSINCPAWPARISGRFEVPILPGYIHMNGHQIRLIADQGYVDSDISRSTQRWMSCFEQRFRQYPSDWVFMLDKRWARILAGVPPPAARSSTRNAGLAPRQRRSRKPEERANQRQDRE